MMVTRADACTSPANVPADTMKNSVPNLQLGSFLRAYVYQTPDRRQMGRLIMHVAACTVKHAARHRKAQRNPRPALPAKGGKCAAHHQHE